MHGETIKQEKILNYIKCKFKQHSNSDMRYRHDDAKTKKQKMWYKL